MSARPSALCQAILVLVMVSPLIGPAALADTVRLTNGNTIQGQVTGMVEGQLQIQQADGTVLAPPIGAVAGFDIAPAAVDGATGTEPAEVASLEAQVARLEMKVNEILNFLEVMNLSLDDRLSQLLATYTQESEVTRQRLYDLNPLSRLFVENDREVQMGRDMAIAGSLRNESGVPLRDVRIVVDLMDDQGFVLATYEETLNETLGPYDRANFRVPIPGAPNNYAVYRITPTVDYRPETEDAGGYMPNRYQNR